MGVWIETSLAWQLESTSMSHPSWVCGLKPLAATHVAEGSQVTPFVGVWIETRIVSIIPTARVVTPFVGVWIETECQQDASALA